MGWGGAEKFQKIIKLGRPIYNQIMINTDKLSPDKLSLTVIPCARRLVVDCMEFGWVMCGLGWVSRLVGWVG